MNEEMTIQEFLEDQSQFFDKLKELAQSKQSEYTRGKSAFHNFEKAKDLSFHNTEPKVAWEYMVKHLQSIKDLLNDHADGKDISDAIIDEKVGDIVVYMTLIRSMLKTK